MQPLKYAEAPRDVLETMLGWAHQCRSEGACCGVGRGRFGGHFSDCVSLTKITVVSNIARFPPLGNAVRRVDIFGSVGGGLGGDFRLSVRPRRSAGWCRRRVGSRCWFGLFSVVTRGCVGGL